MNIEYLLKGLTGLANAPSKSWFYGHFGAVIIAGEFLISECELPEEIVPYVRKHLDKFINSQPELFKELSNDSFEPDWEKKILGSLEKNLARLRNSGHGVIFGTLALKAIRESEIKVSKSIVDGIVKLLELTTTDSPDRYFSTPDYNKVIVEPNDSLPPYKNEIDMIRACFSELNVVYDDQTIDGKTYFFSGCKIHGVTHAHALCVLDNLGYKDLSRKGFENHRLQMKLNRHKPPNDEKLTVEKLYCPFNLDFWNRPLDDTHYIKYPYSALSLLKKLPKEEQEEYKEKIALLWSY